MNFSDILGAVLVRDWLRGRKQRQRVRDSASIQFDHAFRTIEDIVIDEYAVANRAVVARLDALDVWLRDLEQGNNVDDGGSEARFASSVEPVILWARTARPRLLQALADLALVRSVTTELRQPTHAYALVSDLIEAVDVYVSAIDTIIGGNFDQGVALVKQAHVSYRRMQTTHGLAGYF